MLSLEEKEVEEELKEWWLCFREAAFTEGAVPPCVCPQRTG